MAHDLIPVEVDGKHLCQVPVCDCQKLLNKQEAITIIRRKTNPGKEGQSMAKINTLYYFKFLVMNKILRYMQRNKKKQSIETVPNTGLSKQRLYTSYYKYVQRTKVK